MPSLKKYISATAAIFLVKLSYCQVVPNTSTQPSAQQVYYLPPVLSAAAKINYVRTWEPWKPLSSVDSVLVQPVANVKQTTAYVDGLGRAVQTVTKQVSPNQKDMVTYKTFDDYGRETLQYLPYVSDSVNGYFKTNPFLEQQTYFSTGALNNNQYAGEQVYYGRTAIESSPLGRPDTVMAPGNSWAGSNRGVISKYLFNTASDSARIWTIADSINSVPATTAMYTRGQLYKTITIDEHSKQVIEYKDKEGKVILKKVQLYNSPAAGHYGWLCTYYIYDVYNQLRCVIQPAGVDQLKASSWSLTSSLVAEQCFRYEYDQRNRMIIKKVPGAGAVWMVYDALDRLVLSQDSMLRAQGKWLYTLYDAMDRPYATGLLTSSSNRTTLQAAAYNSTSYPVFNESTCEELTHTYFDNYSYGGVKSWDSDDVSKLSAGENPYPESIGKSELTYGLPTGSVVKVLGTSTFLATTTYYDNKGRVAQTLSDNEKGGVDITTMQYDFSGKALSNYLKHNNPSSQTATTTVLTKMLYDQGGRLLRIWKQINDSETDKLILENSYDELGELKSKKLAPGYNEDAGLETLNYEYNIRGWLKAINKDFTENVNSGSWFGQVLSYNYGFNSQQYNGNISGIKWRSKGDGEQRAYGYTYDAVNRLVNADFTQYTNSSWNVSAGIDFTVNTLQYDANGNLLGMFQKGWKLGGSSYIDQLKYTYQTSSNKLKRVVDFVNDYTSKLGDFKYDPATKDSTIDYGYDGNGNLQYDRNKKISSISYNHLNLPETITVTGKGTITYLYDAAGNKLKKTTVDDSLSTTTVTDYISGFIYQNDSLQFFAHEEGRVRYIPPAERTEASFVFDYFIKDHLGNVRMTLTEEQRSDAYPAATMETDNASSEELIYSNLPESRDDRPEYEDDYTDPNDKAARVTGSTSKGPMLGPAIALKVMSGDKFNIRVSSYYDRNAAPGTPDNLLPTLLEHLNTAAGNLQGSHFTPTELTSSNAFLAGVTTFLGLQTAEYDDEKPKAFISWILFDEKFNLVESSSGYEQVEEDERLTVHAFNDLTVDKSGYLYIYVSNADPYISVFFDNLQVTHIRGPLLEETHYYPFGLSMAGISSKALNFGSPDNKRKFTFQELDNDLELNWYQMRFRNYDPQIGRFAQIDPLADDYVYNSTYAYAENDVIRSIDLEGLEKLVITSKKMQGSVIHVTAERVLRNGKQLNNNISLKDENGKSIAITKGVLRLQNNNMIRNKRKDIDQTDGISPGEAYIMKEGKEVVKTADGTPEKCNQMEVTSGPNNEVVGQGEKFCELGDQYIRSEGYVSGKSYSKYDVLNSAIGVDRQMDELKNTSKNLNIETALITLTGPIGSLSDLSKIEESIKAVYKNATIKKVESKDFKSVGTSNINFNATIYVVNNNK